MAAARAIIALFVVGLSGAEECGLDAASCPGEDEAALLQSVHTVARMAPEEIKQEAETKDLWAQSDKMWAQADELRAESERLTNPPAADVGEGSSAPNVTSTGAGDGDLWAQSNKEWAQVKRAEADIDQARKANGSNTSNASSGYVTTVDGVTVFGLVQEAGRMTPEEIKQKQADIKHRQAGIKPQQAQADEASAGAVARMAGDIGEGSNTTNVTRAGAGETLVTDGHHRAVVGDKGSVIKFR